VALGLELSPLHEAENTKTPHGMAVSAQLQVDTLRSLKRHCVQRWPGSQRAVRRYSPRTVLINLVYRLA